MPWLLGGLVVVGILLVVFIWKVRRLAIRLGAATDAEVFAFFAAKDWNRLRGIAGLAKDPFVRGEAKRHLQQLARADPSIRESLLRSLNPRNLGRSQFEQGPLRSDLDKELFRELANLDVADALGRVREQILQLVDEHPRSSGTIVVGLGSGSGEAVLRTVAGVCGDAAEALRSGLDVQRQPIAPNQVAAGLQRLLADARHDMGLVATVLDPIGVAGFQANLRDIEAAAARLG